MEKLARMTTAISGYKEKVDGYSFGGLSGEDLAHALGKLRNDYAPSHLMRFKYCHDPREGRRLLSFIAGAIMTSCNIPENMNKDMAMLVMETYVIPNHCVVCQGKGEMMAGELKIVCRACNGAGIADKTDLFMAQALHISKIQWQNKYEREFNSIMSIVADWEHRGRAAIFEALLWE